MTITYDKPLLDIDKQNEKTDALLDIDLLGENKIQTMEELADEAVTRATYIVAQCRQFKDPRISQIKKYRELYAGKVPRKFRQPFNVVLPTFAGAMDTLQAAFNDDLAMRFDEQEPADYMSAKKIQLLWDQEVTSSSSNAKFPMKCRCDRANALYSGRGFAVNYGQSIPKYRNNFEIFELDDAIFQPLGGVHLENHLYAGRENVIRSKSDLVKGAKAGVYDKTQLKKMLEYCAKTDHYPVDDMEIRNYLAKFKASGLNPSDSNYIGEHIFNLTEMGITINGVRYYLLFSPWYRTWLRFEKLETLFSSNRWPFKSWATHEDNRNFLSKSYADDMYGVADAVHTLFNQELTNREKRNFNARAFDKDMFPDVGKLDAAQTRPDALVAADTKGGTRKISEGIYSFTTAELTGTINLIEFMNSSTGRDVGVTDLSMGGVQNASKKATVVFAEQQNISKRLLLRSSPYTEFMAEIGNSFIESLKDHMPARMALQAIGDQSVGFDEITRLDLDTYRDLNIRIVSSAMEMRNSQLKKEARMKTLAEISADPKQSIHVNSRAIVEEKLRSGAEMEDHEIAVVMDTKNYGNKEETSFAHGAIQEILADEKPDLYYGATTIFLEIIYNYARNYKSKIGNKKYLKYLDYIQAHVDIVKENLEKKAQTEKQAMDMAARNEMIANGGVAENGGGAPANPIVPAPTQNAAGGMMKSAQTAVREASVQ